LEETRKKGIQDESLKLEFRKLEFSPWTG